MNSSLSYRRYLIVFMVILAIFVSENAVLIEAKKGGWFGRAVSGRRTSPSRVWKPSSSVRRVIPVIPANYGRRGGGFGVGKSALTGALAGLAAGYVGAKIGRALAGGWYGGRYYYYDRHYHYTRPDRLRCTIITPNDYPLKYDDGVRVTQIIFECDRYTERCCIDRCCSKFY